MTSTLETDWTTHAQRLADTLRDNGDLRSPQWHAAVAAVPRHLLVPRAYQQDNTGTWTEFDTATARSGPTPVPAARAEAAADGQSRSTDAPAEPWNTASVAWFLAQLRLPVNTGFTYILDPVTRAPVATTYSAPDGSWARVHLTLSPWTACIGCGWTNRTPVTAGRSAPDPSEQVRQRVDRQRLPLRIGVHRRRLHLRRLIEQALMMWMASHIPAGSLEEVGG